MNIFTLLCLSVYPFRTTFWYNFEDSGGEGDSSTTCSRYFSACIRNWTFWVGNPKYWEYSIVSRGNKIWKSPTQCLEIYVKTSPRVQEFPDINFCSELITGRNFLLRSSYWSKIDFQNSFQDEIVQKLFWTKNYVRYSILSEICRLEIYFHDLFFFQTQSFHGGVHLGNLPKMETFKNISWI